MNEPIDVLIFGLGAIGSFYAFILNRSGRVRLTVVARSNYNAIKNNGILIDSEKYGQHRIHPYNVVKHPSEASGLFHYVICANKAIRQDEVVSQLAPAVDETKTTIVVIQNGVGNEEPFRMRFPGCTIITCVTWVGATQISLGVVKHSRSEDMQIGLFPNTSIDPNLEQARLDTFASLLREGKTRFQVLEDIQRQRWEKVVWNAAWNSLTTLTMLDTQSWLRSSPDASPLVRKLMREVIDVGRRCGVPLEYDLIDQLMAKVNSYAGIGSSMQTDCKNGRPMEIDVILGFPLKKAKQFGIETPVLETLHALLRAVDFRLQSKI